MLDCLSLGLNLSKSVSMSGTKLWSCAMGWQNPQSSFQSNDNQHWAQRWNDILYVAMVSFRHKLIQKKSNIYWDATCPETYCSGMRKLVEKPSKCYHPDPCPWMSSLEILLAQQYPNPWMRSQMKACTLVVIPVRFYSHLNVRLIARVQNSANV